MAQIPSNMNIDTDKNMIRGRFTLTNRANLRSLLILSSTLSISYHQYIELNNDLSNTISWKLIDSSQLSYAGEVEIGNLVRLVTDKDFASNSQCIYNEIPTLKKKP